MVTPFTLSYTNDATGSTVTYTSDNITNINIDFSTPIAPMPLPQMEDKENILIKVEGNTTTANVTWKIRDRGTTPFTSGSGTIPASIYGNADTALEQIQVFKDNFVPIVVGDKYTLVIGDSLTMKGTLQKMSFSVSSSSPVIWDGSFQFVVGNVTSSSDSLLASAPVNNSGGATLSISDDSVTSNPSHGVKVNQLKTLEFGADTGITGYIVQYRAVGTSGWSQVPANDIDYSISATTASTQTLTVELGSAGNYEFRVSAKTTTNSSGNKWTNPSSSVTVQ